MKVRLWLLGIALLVAACENDFRPPLPPSVPTLGPKDLITALARAYQTQNHDLFASLLAHDPDRNAGYLWSDLTPTSETQWGYEEEVRIHRRMFKPEDPLPGETPVPAALWINEVDIRLTAITPFTERADLYSTNGGGLDPKIWKATDAQYSTDALFSTQGTQYQVRGQENFVVVEDLTKKAGDAGKFQLLIWEDLCGSSGIPKPEVQTMCWSQLKGLYAGGVTGDLDLVKSEKDRTWEGFAPR